MRRVLKTVLFLTFCGLLFVLLLFLNVSDVKYEKYRQNKLHTRVENNHPIRSEFLRKPLRFQQTKIKFDLKAKHKKPKVTNKHIEKVKIFFEKHPADIKTLISPSTTKSSPTKTDKLIKTSMSLTTSASSTTSATPTGFSQSKINSVLYPPQSLVVTEASLNVESARKTTFYQGRLSGLLSLLSNLFVKENSTTIAPKSENSWQMNSTNIIRVEEEEKNFMCPDAKLQVFLPYNYTPSEIDAPTHKIAADKTFETFRKKFSSILSEIEFLMPDPKFRKVKLSHLPFKDYLERIRFSRVAIHEMIYQRGDMKSVVDTNVDCRLTKTFDRFFYLQKLISLLIMALPWSPYEVLDESFDREKLMSHLYNLAQGRSLFDVPCRECYRKINKRCVEIFFCRSGAKPDIIIPPPFFLN